MRPHPAITATLLDFLCRIIQNFYPVEQEKVRHGIYSSLRQIVDKRVLPSLSPLFDNPRLDKELRSMLKDRFGVFLSREEEDRSEANLLVEREDVFAVNEPGAPAFSDDEEDNSEISETMSKGYTSSMGSDRSSQSITYSSSGSFDSSTKATDFNSILERDNSISNSSVKKVNSKRSNSNHVSCNGENDVLEDDIVSKLEELRTEDNCERRCEIM